MSMEFEQLPNESNKAFEAFTAYLHMGPDRSAAAVGKALGKSKAVITEWSSKHNWVARVQAYNAHLALASRQAMEAAFRDKAAEWLDRQRDHREEEWKMRNELLEAAREALRRWKANPEKIGTLEGIARMLELASKLGRLASGMPTDRTEVKEEVTATLDVEWEMALQRVYGKAKAAAPTVIDAEVVK